MRQTTNISDLINASAIVVTRKPRGMVSQGYQGNSADAIVSNASGVLAGLSARAVLTGKNYDPLAGVSNASSATISYEGKPLFNTNSIPVDVSLAIGMVSRSSGSSVGYRADVNDKKGFVSNAQGALAGMDYDGVLAGLSARAILAGKESNSPRVSNASGRARPQGMISQEYRP